MSTLPSNELRRSLGSGRKTKLVHSIFWECNGVYTKLRNVTDKPKKEGCGR